jgi:hypothetical protein
VIASSIAVHRWSLVVMMITTTTKVQDKHGNRARMIAGPIVLFTTILLACHHMPLAGGFAPSSSATLHFPAPAGTVTTKQTDLLSNNCHNPDKLPSKRRHDQQPMTRSSTRLYNKSSENNDDDLSPAVWWSRITDDPKQSVLFSILMATSGAILGPFLDSYHSAFGVLRYDDPIQFILWGTSEYPALTTAWWVPELFGLAGFLIGWLYILLDVIILEKPQDDDDDSKMLVLTPSPPKILLGISFFTLQYWLSGSLVQAGVDRTSILNLMAVLAAGGFWVLDGTLSGLLTSAAVGIGGPLIEVALIWCTTQGLLVAGGYHYTDLGETGFFPLWIVPVYFLGGPANGNLARGFWNWLSSMEDSSPSDAITATSEQNTEPCPVCNDTRCAPCPNCDGVGNYVAMGGRTVNCTSCGGRGFVICRACFDRYDDDPYDIDAIREKMSRMPD